MGAGEVGTAVAPAAAAALGGGVELDQPFIDCVGEDQVQGAAAGVHAGQGVTGGLSLRSQASTSPRPILASGQPSKAGSPVRLPHVHVEPGYLPVEQAEQVVPCVGAAGLDADVVGASEVVPVSSKTAWQSSAIPSVTTRTWCRTRAVTCSWESTKFSPTVRS